MSGPRIPLDATGTTPVPRPDTKSSCDRSTCRTGSYRPFFNFNYRRELAEGNSTTDLTFSGFPNSDFQVQGIGVPANTYSGKMGLTFVPLIGEATFTYEFKVATGQRRQTAGVRVRF